MPVECNNRNGGLLAFRLLCTMATPIINRSQWSSQINMSFSLILLPSFGRGWGWEPAKIESQRLSVGMSYAFRNCQSALVNAIRSPARSRLCWLIELKAAPLVTRSHPKA